MAMANGVLASALSAHGRRLMSARHLASFTGLAQSVYLAVPTARLYLRAIHDCISTRWSWSSRVRLNKQAIRDLRWWAKLSSQGLGRAIWRSPNQAVLHSDASMKAWGGVLNGTALAHGLWTAAERRHHITVLELIAVLRNIEAFLPRLKGKRILLHEDNMAVCFILRELTSRSRDIMYFLRQLWLTMQESEIEFGRVAYIRSAENPADAPSREKSWDEWRLCDSIFASASAEQGPYSVDRFASQHTKLCSRYNSRWADPSAEGEPSAFCHNWTEEHNWVHPPISELDNVALKIRLEPCWATVVAPMWASYSWFRELRSLSESMEVLPAADTLADQSFLQKWGVRGPGSWPLVLFHITKQSATAST
jgi:hypothetical protein